MKLIEIRLIPISSSCKQIEKKKKPKRCANCIKQAAGSHVLQLLAEGADIVLLSALHHGHDNRKSHYVCASNTAGLKDIVLTPLSVAVWVSDIGDTFKLQPALYYRRTDRQTEKRTDGLTRRC